MSIEFLEAAVNIASLPFVTVVEGNLLGVSEQITVEGTVLSLKSRFLSSESSEGWGDDFDDPAGEGVPCERNGGAFPTDQLRQLPGEEEHVKDGLAQVGVELGEAGGPLGSICSQALIWVGDTVVQVADLVVMHVAQILLVEVQGETLSVEERELLHDVVDARIDCGGWYGKKEQIKDLEEKYNSVSKYC